MVPACFSKKEHLISFHRFINVWISLDSCNSLIVFRVAQPLEPKAVPSWIPTGPYGPRSAWEMCRDRFQIHVGKWRKTQLGFPQLISKISKQKSGKVKKQVCFNLSLQIDKTISPPRHLDSHQVILAATGVLSCDCMLKKMKAATNPLLYVGDQEI